MQEVIIYVHVPFCSSKCHFCSWVSPIPTTELVRSKDKFGSYAQAVVSEIKGTASRLRSAAIKPKLVYFGGGTPSLLSGEDLASILNEIFTQFPKDESFLDTTIEMSPDTVTEDKLKILRQAGFSRISFGVQSFNEQRARSIGRAHTPMVAISAFEKARKAGFDNINLDLMIGFPDESEQEYRGSVETALMLDPDHISIYVYKKIQGTVMSKLLDGGKINACPQDVAIARYYKTGELLARAGYSEYMFQLFEKRGKPCYVDYHYFRLSYDHLGFGQGAHTLAGGKAYSHGQTLEQYLKKPGHDTSMPAADSDTLLETKLFEMLHTDEGLDYRQFETRLKITVDEALARSSRFRRAVSCVLETDGVEQTSTGIRFSSHDARVKWLVRPPFWDQSYSASMPAESLVSIAAAV